MITKQQALTANHFHAGECKVIDGPKDGEKRITQLWRRNGRTQTWVTRPDEFRVPVKHGLYDTGAITHQNAHQFHVADDPSCPLNQR